MEKKVVKNNIVNITENPVLQSTIDKAVELLDKENFSIEKIKETMQDLTAVTRALFHLSALTTGNQELAAKISIANSLIKQENVNKAIENITNNTGQVFLASLSTIDKISLQADLELLGDFAKPETKKALELLEYSIQKDLIDKATVDRFDNLENQFEKPNRNTIHAKILL